MMSSKSIGRKMRGESGQILPLVAVAALVMILFAGMTIDFGRVWIAKQQLQRAVDAAALVAGQDLPNTSTAFGAAQSYSAYGTTGSNGKNPMSGWGVTLNAPPTVTFKCVANGPNYSAGTCPTDTSSSNCHPSNSYYSSAAPATNTCNAVTITETATVSTGLLSFVIPSFTVKASSTSGARDDTSITNPMNIAVILDTTGSMSAGSSDLNLTSGNSAFCSATVTGISAPYYPDKLDCAKAGVRALLQALPYTTVNGASVADDEVGMVVFPALSSVLSPTGSSTASFTGTTTTSGTNKNKITSTSITVPSSDVGDTITGTGIPSNTTITAISGTTVTISNNATKSGTNVSFTITVPNSGPPYVLQTPPTASLNDETDCTSSDSFGVTYPPWSLNGSATGAIGGIPAADVYSYGTNSSYASPGIIDNYQGYDAVQLSGDYQTGGSLNNSSNLVKSVYWAQCSGGGFPGGDYYGLKDIGGQGSYLAGAISAAQYMLASSTRTTGPTGAPVTNAIIILSDGELNDPNSSGDGVDSGASGNVSFSSSTPCEDAVNAAAGAKAAGTTVFTIAYDDSGGTCDDGSGTNHYNGSAQALMQALATPTSSNGTPYYYTESSAGDLTDAFQTAAETLSPGNSRLLPDS